MPTSNQDREIGKILLWWQGKSSVDEHHRKYDEAQQAIQQLIDKAEKRADKAARVDELQKLVTALNTTDILISTTSSLKRGYLKNRIADLSRIKE